MEPFRVSEDDRGEAFAEAGEESEDRRPASAAVRR
jgi:hypothetical protein